MTENAKRLRRRKFLRTTAAVGAATTGIVGLTGNAAAQNVNANSLFGSGLVVVNVQDAIDVGDITVEDVTVEIIDTEDINVEVTDVNVLNDNVVKILNDVTVEDNLNQNQVTVQVSILGNFVGTDTVNVPGNLQ